MPQVVIVVFDGLNEELVTPEIMPRLSAFAAGGTRLANHRPVFPSVTRLNAAAMVTGCFPGTHGLAANLSLVPEFHPTEPMDALEPQLAELRRRTGRVLFVPTLAEMLAEHGMEYIAAGVGTSGQAFLHHPNGEDAEFGATIHTDFTLPRDLDASLVEQFGAWPEKTIPNSARIEHVTTLFLDYVLRARDPATALLWFSEPDSSEHATGPHSPTVQQAVRDADTQFGRLLDWIEASGRDIDVIVTCDHGQSTIIQPIPVAQLLLDAGFAAPGEPGGVIVAGNGGAALFYIDGHDHEVADRLAAWLMAQPWAGPMLTSDRLGEIEGTLSQSLVGVDGDRSPDLALSFAWSGESNAHGQPGMIYASGGAAGRGTHGSMSPWEFRTFTIASGPSFKRAARIEVATGHPDITPTVLHLLGLPIPAHVQGRVMTEALAETSLADTSGTPEVHVASRVIGDVEYRQQIEIAPSPRAGQPAHLLAASVTRSVVVPVA